ncbi:MAG: MMPL family transporter [Sporolactobacillus sp.]
MRTWILQFAGACAGKKGKWITLVVWIVLVSTVSALFPSAQKMTDNSATDLSAGQPSVQAEQVIKKYFPNTQGTPLLIVWNRSDGLTPADLNAVQQLYTTLDRRPLSQQSFIPPYRSMPAFAFKKMISGDGTTLVTPVFMKSSADAEQLTTDMQTLKDRIKKIGTSKWFSSSLEAGGLHLRFTGPAAIATDAVSLFKQADVTLLLATVLLVLFLLIVIYRSPILAIVPLIGVGFAYGLAGPILGLLAKNHVITIDSQGVSIMTVLLFGAGTDYCLFLVSRYREYLFKEKDKYRALQQAINHSGGAIMVSAITVALSLLTLLLASLGSIHRFAVPFAVAISAMGIAALTLLPALLAIFGRASFFPFIPRTPEMLAAVEKDKGRKPRQQRMHGRVSHFLGQLVVRRPWTVILVTAVLLGSLALFASRIETTQNLLASFPKTMPSREGFTLIGDHFSPGELAPVQIVVKADGKQLPLVNKLSQLKNVASVSTPQKSTKNSDMDQLQVILKGDPFNEKAISSIPSIRQTIAATLKSNGIRSGGHYWIGGETAKLYDTVKTTDRDTVLIVTAVIAIITILLLSYLKSVIAAVYLILTVLLSYGSALGAGWFVLHDLMGSDALNGLIPLYAFVFLVALGEDYNIFMVSGIWKNRQLMPHREAIASGVSETSTVITSAGLILAGTFAVLATLPIQVLLQFGVVTAVGVLLDTFIVRPLLVPAITTVLGRYAYWPGKLWHKTDSRSRQDA